MTDKLYYDDTLCECDATVLECREGSAGAEVLLDKTVIYPEGGGQLSDTGYIEDARVSYAFEEGENIWHRTDRRFAIGERVHVRFDKEMRFDHSRQHTGEHMLSGIANTLFGCQNVGFHMTEEYVSIDMDKQLTAEDVLRLEIEANAAVMRNEETKYRLVTAEELENITIRKKAKGLTGEIRIVYAGGVDSCTCCGTHVRRAGEVGLIKIASHQNYKGGTRIFFNCGMRAVREMAEDKAIVDAAARRFSTKAENVLSSIVTQGDELTALRRKMKQRSEELFGYKAEELIKNAALAGNTRVVTAALDGLDMAELMSLASSLAAHERVVAALFSANGDSLIYRVMRSKDEKLSMRELATIVNGMINGKGGGREDSAQGSAANTALAKEAVIQLESYLIKRLNAEK